ncbi:MAG: hypothetical protein CMO55_26870 [Verrucomicrobiales bacterium]|nr:hypothetical protein [Verrucomicrobiales bacterium]
MFQFEFRTESPKVSSAPGKSTAWNGLFGIAVSVFFLIIFTLSANADTVAIPFSQPKEFPLSFRLSIPKEDSVIVSHTKENRTDTITVRLIDDRAGGLAVEALNADAERVWLHDFGYNLSATNGCSVSITFHPTVSAVIISYRGYKWDHAHKLFFAKKEGAAHVLSECSTKAPEIASFLEKQEGYSSKHKYRISPYKFENNRVVFECIPLELPERSSVHPFAQDVPSFHVTASISPDFEIVPIEIKKTN